MALLERPRTHLSVIAEPAFTGPELKRIRESLGLSVAHVSNLTCLSHHAVQHVEVDDGHEQDRRKIQQAIRNHIMLMWPRIQPESRRWIRKPR